MLMLIHDEDDYVDEDEDDYLDDVVVDDVEDDDDDDVNFHNDDDDDVGYDDDEEIYLFEQVLKEALECSIHEATGMHCNVIYLILYVVKS